MPAVAAAVGAGGERAARALTRTHTHTHTHTHTRTHTHTYTHSRTRHATHPRRYPAPPREPRQERVPEPRAHRHDDEQQRDAEAAAETAPLDLTVFANAIMHAPPHSRMQIPAARRIANAIAHTLSPIREQRPNVPERVERVAVDK